MYCVSKKSYTLPLSASIYPLHSHMKKTVAKKLDPCSNRIFIHLKEQIIIQIYYHEQYNDVEQIVYLLSKAGALDSGTLQVRTPIHWYLWASLWPRRQAPARSNVLHDLDGNDVVHVLAELTDVGALKCRLAICIDVRAAHASKN